MATTYRIPILRSRREFFRLPYPVTSGATLESGDTNYKVEEISERGLRIVADAAQFPLETDVEGTLVLTMGLRCKISGKVLRVEGGVVVVKLERGPTTCDINREQRHLSKTFPNWKPLPA
ncbi:MAG TPA: PilZ domain-containing protein [Steroidobacteraceae bacterium]|nr:PilZ domain-containing protein [Steroidobacteraceae bacterium]